MSILETGQFTLWLGLGRERIDETIPVHFYSPPRSQKTLAGFVFYGHCPYAPAEIRMYPVKLFYTVALMLRRLAASEAWLAAR